MRIERQIAKHLGQRLAPGQANGADSADVVEHDDALEHVVDLVEAHVEDKLGVAVDHRLIFEVADPAGRE